MGKTFFLLNGAVYIALAIKFVLIGVRGTVGGYPMSSMGFGRNPSPPEKPPLRTRSYNVGIGAALGMLGILNLGKGLILALRPH
jgi:hypothetical protein